MCRVQGVESRHGTPSRHAESGTGGGGGGGGGGGQSLKTIMAVLHCLNIQ